MIMVLMTDIIGEHRNWSYKIATIIKRGNSTITCHVNGKNTISTCRFFNLLSCSGGF
jgi:hypothetical protein